MLVKPSDEIDAISLKYDDNLDDVSVNDNKRKYLGIQIDLSRDKLFDELGLRRLKESYMHIDELSPQYRYAYVAKMFGSNINHSQRLYDYASKHWLSFATPILAFHQSKKGLPISCFLVYMPDSSEGLIDTLSEVNWLSMKGGGVGIHVMIRSEDGKSVGVMPHAKIYDASCLAYRQGLTRRGSYALFLDMSHPNIVQFLEMRKPTGDQNIRCLNLHHGVNICNKFMEIIERCMIDPTADDTWELFDPSNPNKIVNKISAKYLWQLLLETRMQTGEPYIHFIDTSNEKLPEWQKNLGLKINGQNLCNEITLATDKDRTAVCCLSSPNDEYYDEWKDNPQFIHDIAEMLDNVLQYFIDNAPDTIIKAKFSAFRERSIGVGLLGFHSYLQSKMIAFESEDAKAHNLEVFSFLNKELNIANEKLAKERGEAPDAEGYGKRFSHTMAVAPTASSSIIMGNTSPSIEPMRANAYRQDTLSGSFLNKNKFLDKLLKKYISDENELSEIWNSIISNDGSVQHLEFLSNYEKNVFKTAMEINQNSIIDLAADRAKLIDQSQSLNVFFRPDADISYIHKIHFDAWKRNIKGLYYCRSDKLQKADNVSQKIERQKIEEIKVDSEECLACSV